jgi:hypothetical protein
MAAGIKSELLNEIIRFAMTRKGISEKSVYLIKGLLFAPFLDKLPRKAGGGDTATLTSEAGDDIYPLF